MERPIFYIVLIMLSHLTTIFANNNESNINRSTNKIENTNKNITFKNDEAEAIPARRVSNDSRPTTDTEIDGGTTESDETIQLDDGAENTEKKTDSGENKRMAAGNAGLFKKERQESLYHPIYSLESLDYFLRHPEKISPNFNPIRSDYSPNNIYNTVKPLQLKKIELLRNFTALPNFYPTLRHESINIPSPTLKGPQDSISALESLQKDPIFKGSELQKIILDFIKKHSLLPDVPESLSNPLETLRVSSQDDIPEWNLQRHNQLKQLSNNVINKNIPLADGSHDKGFHKVLNVQQVSVLSSGGSRLPQEFNQAIKNLFNNIAVPLEPKILKDYSTLFERLLNTHPFENVPSLQQQSLAPNSSPSLDKDQAHLKNAHVYPDIPKLPNHLDDIFSSFIDNNSIFPEKSKTLKGTDAVSKDVVSSNNTSSMVEQYQLTKVPLLKLETSPSKDIPLQFNNLPPNNNVSSLVYNSAVFGDDSLKKNIPTLGDLFLSGKNSQTEAEKSTDFSSLLEKTPSDLTKIFEFFSVAPYQPGTLTSVNSISLDKSLSSSENRPSPSKNTIVELTNGTEKPSYHSLISQNNLLFNKTQSTGNITFADNTHNVSLEYKSMPVNYSPFQSVPNSKSSQNKLLHTTVYFHMPPFLATKINEQNKKLKDSTNKNAHSWQTKTNAAKKVAQVGNTKKEKNPDCLKGIAWMSKCHDCTCSDDGFPDCKIIQHCVLPPREKPMLCKPYTSFGMGECNICTCSGDGLPICKFTDCYLHGNDNTKKLIPIRTSIKNNKEIKEKSTRDEDINDILRSNDSDYSIDGKNDTDGGNRKSKFNFDDEDFDTGIEYGHRRVGKRRSHGTTGSHRCEVGSVWDMNCFNCFCGLDGLPNCDKIAHCSLLPYGKPPRCKPTTVFENRCGGICKCDDEGETWCEECY